MGEGVHYQGHVLANGEMPHAGLPQPSQKNVGCYGLWGRVDICCAWRVGQMMKDMSKYLGDILSTVRSIEGYDGLTSLV